MSNGCYPTGWFRMSWLKDRASSRVGHVRIYGVKEAHAHKRWMGVSGWGKAAGIPMLRFKMFLRRPQTVSGPLSGNPTD